METNQFQKLKGILPAQYGKLISKKLAEKKLVITTAQVRLVFDERITNPQIVIPVLEAARLVHNEQEKIKALQQL
jgi:hypothetical protein